MVVGDPAAWLYGEKERERNLPLICPSHGIVRHLLLSDNSLSLSPHLTTLRDFDRQTSFSYLQGRFIHFYTHHLPPTTTSLFRHIIMVSPIFSLTSIYASFSHTCLCLPPYLEIPLTCPSCLCRDIPPVWLFVPSAFYLEKKRKKGDSILSPLS